MHQIIGGYQMATTIHRQEKEIEEIEPEEETPIQETRKERQKQKTRTDKLWDTFRIGGINDLAKLKELESLLIKQKMESGKINAVQGAITNYNMRKRKNVLKAIALINNRQ